MHRFTTIAAIFIAASFAAGGAFAQELTEPRTGQPFPNFKVTDALTGKVYRNKDLRGKVVLVDFWATWCRPCVAEIPHLKETYEKFHADGFEIVSVSLDRSQKKAESFVKSRKMEWIHEIPGKGWNAPLAKRFRIKSIPRMFLIDRNGVLINADLRGKAILPAVQRAVEQKPDPGAFLDEEASASSAGDDEADASADLTDADVSRAKRWFAIADGMSQNKNHAIARRYYKKIAETYPRTIFASQARQRLEQIAAR